MKMSPVLIHQKEVLKWGLKCRANLGSSFELDVKTSSMVQGLMFSLILKNKYEASTVVYFDQLSGAFGSQKLVEIL